MYISVSQTVPCELKIQAGFYIEVLRAPLYIEVLRALLYIEVLRAPLYIEVLRALLYIEVLRALLYIEVLRAPLYVEVLRSLISAVQVLLFCLVCLTRFRGGIRNYRKIKSVVVISKLCAFVIDIIVNYV